MDGGAAFGHLRGSCAIPKLGEIDEFWWGPLQIGGWLLSSKSFIFLKESFSNQWFWEFWLEGGISLGMLFFSMAFMVEDVSNCCDVRKYIYTVAGYRNICWWFDGCVTSPDTYCGGKCVGCLRKSCSLETPVILSAFFWRYIHWWCWCFSYVKV